MAPHDFLADGSETSALICDRDWSQSLGPIETWAQSLKTVVGLMVRSPVPMVLLWGTDGIMIYNDAYSRFAGGRHPQLLGSKVREGWPEVASFNDNVMKVGLAGGTLAYTDQELTLYRHGVAEQVWMNLDYSPVIGESGRPAGVIAVVIETTDRVLAVRRREQQWERQRQLFQQMPGFVAVLMGPEHTYEYVNEAYVRITGHRDFVGKTVQEALPELDGQGVFELLDRVYASGERHIGHGMAIQLSGETESRFLDFVYEPIRSENDRSTVIGIFVGGYDATETYRAIGNLRTSEMRLRDLNAELEHKIIERTQARGRTWQVSPDLMGALNSKGYFETSNPAWKTMLGWSEEEVAGMSIFELLHPDDVERTREGFNLTQQGQPAIRFPNRYRCKDGRYRWISWVGVPEDGMVYCSGRDITDEKAAEDALVETQEALRQSQKMEAVGQLTGGIAHDFNNMLAVVLGALNLLTRRSKNIDPDARKYIDTAIEGVNRAAQLTQRLLAFSRQQALVPAVIDVNKLVGSMSELLRGSLGRGIVLETVAAAGLWKVYADPNQLENAVLNLALNARDAMPEGGKLTIETQNAHIDGRYAAAHHNIATGQYLLIAVTDTGAGMSPDVVAKAFDPFFTTKGVGKGTGLGLSQVYGFVKQSGGHIKIYSEPGQGTSVKIYLPRLANEPAGTFAAAPGTLPIAEGHQELVLVVDDDDAVRAMAVESLRELGYRVIDAANARAALALLEDRPDISLLFTDIVMPETNGRKLADEALRLRPDLKVLFTTGYTRNAVVHNGVLDAGVNLIGKPFTIEELADKIREVLDTNPGDS